MADEIEKNLFLMSLLNCNDLNGFWAIDFETLKRMHRVALTRGVAK